MRSYDPIIPKERLEIGKYYLGVCRNARVARWDGKQFWYWRYKFGKSFLESISCPEDESVFDVFIAEELIKEIPL